MEHVDSLHFLACADKFYRLCHHRADAYRRSAPSVAVEFRKHNSVEIQTVVELLGRINCILTGHRVDDEQRLVGMNRVLKCFNLVHHLLVDGQTAGRIYDYDIITLCLGFLYRIAGNLDNVFIPVFRINRHAYLSCNDFELLDSRRAVNVACNKKRILMLLLLQHICQFATESGLT